MRRFLPLLVLPLVACVDPADDPYDHPPNEIVFGIQQSFGEGNVARVTAGYDFIGLSHASRPMAYFASGSGDGACYFERLSDRVGHAPSDPGTATFTGGTLPPAGLTIAANTPDTTFEGAGWTSTDRLHFRASGFAMPSIPEVDFYAPPISLGITSIVPESTITSADDVTVTWTPTGGSNVVVTLDTDDGGQVRCFASASVGKAVLPHAWVRTLFDSVDRTVPITGHLRVASHKQVTIAAESNWLVYVVTTSLHHDGVFTGSRN